jgi:ACR3 family arsenite efflux pump ArsB
MWAISPSAAFFLNVAIAEIPVHEYILNSVFAYRIVPPFLKFGYRYYDTEWEGKHIPLGKQIIPIKSGMVMLVHTEVQSRISGLSKYTWIECI